MVRDPRVQLATSSDDMRSGRLTTEHSPDNPTQIGDRSGGQTKAKSQSSGMTATSSQSESRTRDTELRARSSNLPMTVKEAALFLGVSAQTVYLWVERKQIPHFRVMGRNIRFLISDLRPFRDQFKENGRTA